MAGPYVTMNEMKGLGNLSGTRTWIKLRDVGSQEEIEGWEDEVWAKLEKEGKADQPWIYVVQEEREYESTASKVGNQIKEGFMNLFSTYIDSQKQKNYGVPTPAPRPAPKKTGANIAIIAGIAAVLGISAWMFMKK